MNSTVTIWKRGLSLLLTVLMLAGCLGLTAFAEEPETDLSEGLSSEEEVAAEPADEAFEEDQDPNVISENENIADDLPAAGTGDIDVETGKEDEQEEAILEEEMVPSASEETDAVVEEQLEEVLEESDEGQTDAALHGADAAGTVSVSFELNGHGTDNLPDPNPQVVKQGEKAVRPEKNPTDEKYRFFDWYADAGLTTLFDFDKEITENTTMYARWRCVVTYDASPGTVTINSQTRDAVNVYRNIGEKAIFHEPNPLEAYEFIEWCSDQSRETPFDFNTPITENTTLYAKYNPQLPIIEEKSGKTADGGYALALDLDYATYKDSVQVRVDNEKLRIPDQCTVTQGSIVITLKKVFLSTLEDGRHFMRVDTAAGFASRYFDITSGNVDTVPEYAVSFEMNGHGEQVPAQKVVSGKKALKPTQDPSESGYIFGGWYANPELTEVFDFDREITEDTTVYARWRCIVTYNASPGTVTISGTTNSIVRVYKNVGAKANKYTPNDLEGYIFIEWCSDESRETPFDFNTPITENTVIYAKYTQVVEQFVRRGYQIMLGRPQVSQEELDFYAAPLKAHELSAAQMIVNFLSSEEFAARGLSYEEIVTITYQTMLNRDPDPEGLAFHADKLEKGISYNALVNNFTGSPEFVEICEQAGGIIPGKLGLLYRDRNLSVTAFVIRCYELGLGRTRRQISGDELEYYCEPLLTKALTAQQVANNFVLSDEAQALYPNDRNFIVMLYHLYMDRDAGEDEISYYMSRLAADATRQSLAAFFGESPEFQRIVKSYGL